MQIPGSIVSCGVIGAVAARLVLGQAIDRFGVLRLWLLSSVGFVAGRLGFLLGDGISWMICAARIAFVTGVAAMFTCSIVHIQNHVPTERRTEIVGNLGSAGFLGMILGSQCGDAIVQSIPEVALSWGADNPYIWIAENSKAKRIEVQIEQRLEGRVLVSGNINRDDTLIVEGVQSLRDGQPIKYEMSELDASTEEVVE